jgi:AmiR/NasT family two-component response regulator
VFTVTTPEEASSELPATVAGGGPPSAAEHLDALSVFVAKLRAEQDRSEAMVEEIEQLHHALESRDIIGQAKGMLMERFDVDADGAFTLLVKLSQESNTPVKVIAQRLVEIAHP